MNIGLILSVLKALLNFPKELGDFIKLFEKTPEQRRIEIMEIVRAQSQESAKTGRPKWE
jgi:hypothetical protein